MSQRLLQDRPSHSDGASQPAVGLEHATAAPLINPICPLCRCGKTQICHTICVTCQVR